MTSSPPRRWRRPWPSWARAGFDLRYAGQAFELTVPGELEPDPADLREAFDRAHEEHYGYVDEDAELELGTVRVAAALPGAEAPAGTGGLKRHGSRRARFGEDEVEAEVLTSATEGEDELDGPAVVELPGSTLVVPPGWRVSVAGDALTMERA